MMAVNVYVCMRGESMRCVCFGVNIFTFPVQVFLLICQRWCIEDDTHSTFDLDDNEEETNLQSIGNYQEEFYRNIRLNDLYYGSQSTVDRILAAVLYKITELVQMISEMRIYRKCEYIFKVDVSFGKFFTTRTLFARRSSKNVIFSYLCKFSKDGFF